MKEYQILKDNRIFAVFHEGDNSRFGLPFNDEIFEKEFKGCQWHWVDSGIDPSRFSKKIIKIPDNKKKNVSNYTKQFGPCNETKSFCEKN